ncbi:MAG: tripartite tricarboxylate transporter TctB family protein [Clostridiales bacterium]|nr:tripartite tricarboxylate transporter TctB family protein [Clostridiales bacterium]
MKKSINPVFKKLYQRLMVEGIIRSLLCGFIVGFTVNFMLAFSFWAFDARNFWLSIVIGVAVGVIATVVFYFLLFKPDEKLIARRVDRLGLEERVITMTEFENDESYIAQKQREDAKVKIGNVSIKSIKYKVSMITIILCCVTFLVGSSMTVVAGLSETGVIKPGSDFIDDIIPPPKAEPVELIYEVDMNIGGFIEGEPIQIIDKGQDGTTVIAVPDDGYFFIGWSDGYKNPTRTDKEVMEDKLVKAQFMLMEDMEEGGEGMGFPVDMEPPPNAKPTDKDIPNDKDSDQHHAMAGDKWEETNFIIDGKTFYLDVYDEYYKAAMEKLAANPDISPELRAVIESYMDILLS